MSHCHCSSNTLTNSFFFYIKWLLGTIFLRYFLNIVHSLFPGDDKLWKLTYTVEDNSVFFAVHFTRRTRRPAALAHEAYWLWNRFRTKYLGNTYKYIFIYIIQITKNLILLLLFILLAISFGSTIFLGGWVTVTGNHFVRKI